MGHELIIDVFRPLAIFGGIGLMVWISVTASIKARLEPNKVDTRPGQTLEAHSTLAEDRVLAELKAMREQMAEMQSTSNQFDISFDAALERLESRVNRLETKSAAATATTPSETGQTLRAGQSL